MNLDRIRKYNAVNLKNGYSILEIRTPREILKQTTMKTNNGFDAVEMMRSIRKKVHDDYMADPIKRTQRLEEIRKRYRSKIKKQETANQ